MKLATLKSSTNKDGELIIVNRDLTRAVKVPDIAKTLQYALDYWSDVEPLLQNKYKLLNNNAVSDAFNFDPKKVAAPLPRSYQWADASAYVNHVELVRKSRGATLPETFWTDPLMYQGGSDNLIGATDDIMVADEEFGIDFEAEVAVITDDVPMGISKEAAKDHIKLLMLVNDVSLRNLVPAELAKGFGFFNSKPASAFSPVAVTLDELDNRAWDGGKVNLPIISTFNGKIFGTPNAGVDMTFDFPKLISHAAKTRFLNAGTIIGSGTVSNADKSKGSSCIAERRMLEVLESGAATTNFMRFGDTIKIEMFDKNNKSIFGAIDQKVVEYIYD